MGYINPTLAWKGVRSSFGLECPSASVNHAKKGGKVKGRELLPNLGNPRKGADCRAPPVLKRWLTVCRGHGLAEGGCRTRAEGGRGLILTLASYWTLKWIVILPVLPLKQVSPISWKELLTCFSFPSFRLTQLFLFLVEVFFSFRSGLFVLPLHLSFKLCSFLPLQYFSDG